MRVATIDIGTNSVLLLVAEKDARGALVALTERATITRLGQGVDRSRALAPDAISRTLACLAEYATEMRTLGVEKVDVVGTSAMRDASGADAFVAEAARLLGTAPRVISGAEEARLTFAGALEGLDVDGELTVFDVGGGSTEFVTGTRGRPSRIASAKSIDVGSVRLFERHVRSDPPSREELAEVRRSVERELAGVAKPAPGQPLVGIAGTVTTIAAVARAIEPYDAERVHGARLGRGEIAAISAKLAALPLAERRALPGLEPKRADVIPVGAAIVEAIVAWAAADAIVVSDRGVRWGLALELAGA